MPLNGVDTLVLYAPVCDVDMSDPLVHEDRQAEVARCGNDNVKREKYLAWKLLGCAAKACFNLDYANVRFTKTENGQWICPDFHFSLSHTDGAVCVAVSRYPVGVDIEKIRPVRQGLYSRVLTDCEMKCIGQMNAIERSDFFLCAWVKKESLFKRGGGQSLLPCAIETVGSDACVHRVNVGGAEYLIGLAHNNDEKYEIRYTEAICRPYL